MYKRQEYGFAQAVRDDFYMHVVDAGATGYTPRDPWLSRNLDLRLNEVMIFEQKILEKSCLNCALKDDCLKRALTIYYLFITTGRDGEVPKAQEELNIASDCDHWEELHENSQQQTTERQNMQHDCCD